MKIMRVFETPIYSVAPSRLWFFARSLLSVVALVPTVVTCFSQAFIVTLEATLLWEATTIYVSAASRHLDLGRNPNSSDTDVEGPGSTLSDPGISIIGDRGTGTLDIIQGGKVTDTAIEIGENSGSRGDVEVDGKGSRLFDRGNATIGDHGEGKLDIRDGGEVCDGANAAFLPQQFVRKRGNVAHVNSAADDDPAFFERFESQRHQLAGWRKNDGSVELFDFIRFRNNFGMSI